MIKSVEDLAHIDKDGSVVYPLGPCSAWPQARNVIAPGAEINYRKYDESRPVIKHQKVKATAAQMVSSLMSTAKQAITTGNLSQVERDIRFETCKHCPSFIPDGERCAECGCFMSAKTYIRGAECPLGKW